MSVCNVAAYVVSNSPDARKKICDLMTPFTEGRRLMEPFEGAERRSLGGESTKLVYEGGVGESRRPHVMANAANNRQPREQSE